MERLYKRRVRIGGYPSSDVQRRWPTFDNFEHVVTAAPMVRALFLGASIGNLVGAESRSSRARG